jgi:hypothetical protein
VRAPSPCPGEPGSRRGPTRARSAETGTQRDCPTHGRLSPVRPGRIGRPGSPRDRAGRTGRKSASFHLFTTPPDRGDRLPSSVGPASRLRRGPQRGRSGPPAERRVRSRRQRTAPDPFSRSRLCSARSGGPARPTADCGPVGLGSADPDPIGPGAKPAGGRTRPNRPVSPAGRTGPKQPETWADPDWLRNSSSFARAGAAGHGPDRHADRAAGTGRIAGPGPIRPARLNPRVGTTTRCFRVRRSRVGATTSRVPIRPSLPTGSRAVGLFARARLRPRLLQARLPGRFALPRDPC